MKKLQLPVWYHSLHGVRYGIPVLVVLAVLLLAGIIPAGLFSSIPVTQVFHRYTERRTAWKRPLLFIQFMGMTFIFGFLIIVLGQYQTVMNKDLGYNPDRVVMCWHQFGNEEGNAKSFFKNLPMVEDYAAAAQIDLLRLQWRYF